MALRRRESLPRASHLQQRVLLLASGRLALQWLRVEHYKPGQFLMQLMLPVGVQHPGTRRGPDRHAQV